MPIAGTTRMPGMFVILNDIWGHFSNALHAFASVDNAPFLHISPLHAYWHKTDPTDQCETYFKSPRCTHELYAN